MTLIVATLPKTPTMKIVEYTTDIGMIVVNGKCWAPKWSAIYFALSGVVVLWSTIDDDAVVAAETEIELLIELKLALKSIIDPKDGNGANPNLLSAKRNAIHHEMEFCRSEGK